MLATYCLLIVTLATVPKLQVNPTCFLISLLSIYARTYLDRNFVVFCFVSLICIQRRNLLWRETLEIDILFVSCKKLGISSSFWPLSHCAFVVPLWHRLRKMCLAFFYDSSRVCLLCFLVRNQFNSITYTIKLTLDVFMSNIGSLL